MSMTLRSPETTYRTIVEQQNFIARSTVSIANGESLSGALSLTPGTRQLVALQMPASWPAAVSWAGGSAPTLTAVADAVDAFELVTVDAGTTWRGQTIGLDFS